MKISCPNKDCIRNKTTIGFEGINDEKISCQICGSEVQTKQKIEEEWKNSSDEYGRLCEVSGAVATVYTKGVINGRSLRQREKDHLNK